MTKVPQGLSRRGVLAAPALAAVAAAVASCGKSEPETGAGAGAAKSSGGHAAVRSGSDLARDRAVAAETDLLARYDAALALPSVIAVPALVAQLGSVRSEHAAHLSAIKQGYAVPPPVSATPTTPAVTPTPTASGTTPTPTPTASGPTPSATTTTDPDSKSTVLALVTAEQNASTRLTTDVMSVDGITAQLLASIAGAEAGHAALLLGGTS